MDITLFKLLSTLFLLLFLIGFILIKFVINYNKILEKLFGSQTFIITLSLCLCATGFVLFAHSIRQVLAGDYNWVSILFLFYPLWLWLTFLEIREGNQNFRQLSDGYYNILKPFLTAMKKVMFSVIKWAAIILAIGFVGSKIDENPIFLVAGLLAIIVYQLDLVVKSLRK